MGDIRAKREALRNDDSLMVSLHMVKGQGWNYAGNFPSANLSLEQIVQGYVDAGMEILEIKEFSSDAKLHEGHSSMVAIVARPRRKHLALAA